MRSDREDLAYTVLADPDGDFRWTGPPPDEQCKVVLDAQGFPRVIVNVVAYEFYVADLPSDASDPFGPVWKAIRTGDASALKDVPFLASAEELSRYKRRRHSHLLTMTKQEILAHRYGPILTVAYFICVKDHTPQLGQMWKVEVAVQDFEGEPERESRWYEFSFEVEITPELLAIAQTLVRARKQALAPKAWLAVRDRMTVFVKENLNEEETGEAIFRTGERDLEELVTGLNEWYLAAVSDPYRQCLFGYVSIWEAHVSPGESRDYYRGACHGLRIVDDFLRLFIGRIEPLFEFVLLEQTVWYLAGVVAERYWDKTVQRAAFPPSELSDQIFGAIRRHRLDPFRLDLVDAAQLASRADDDLLASMGPLSGKIPYDCGKHSTRILIEAGDNVDFYRGLTQNLCLCERIVSLFRRKVYALPAPSLITNLEGGFQRMSYVAARHWLEAASATHSTIRRCNLS